VRIRQKKRTDPESRAKNVPSASSNHEPRSKEKKKKKKFLREKKIPRKVRRAKG